MGQKRGPSPTGTPSPQSKRLSYLAVDSPRSITSPSGFDVSISPSPSSLGTPSSPPTFTTSGSNLEDYPSATERVCFGTLNRVQILLKWAPKASEQECTSMIQLDKTGTSVRILTLRFEEGHCVLLSSGSAVGVLEDRALRPFAALANDPSPVKYEAVIAENEWKAKISLVDGQVRKGQRLVVDIDVFGSESRADDVARQLGRAHFFLQRPSRWLLPPLMNPQCLELPTAASTLSTAAAETSKLNLNFDWPGLETRGVLDFDGCEDYTLDIDELLQGAAQFSGVGEFRVNERIVTPLLPHQVEAAEFIMRREGNGSSDVLSLWEPFLDEESNAMGYEHVITGAKSEREEEMLGGILAHDMGMGKTLSMLSAIVTSLPQAHEFASLGDLTPEYGGHGTLPLPIRASLVVVHSELLLAGWVKEINRHTSRGALSYYKYHGKNRATEASTLTKYDIVLTTYGTIAADASRQKGLLRNLHWYRAVLDEAHVIRNWETKQFEAVHAIPANVRWCITGTPIQNGLDDLAALTRFLKVPILEDTATFRKYITAEATPKRNQKADFSNLRLLLGSICLRRQQAFPSTTEILRPAFSTEEMRRYKTLEVVWNQALKTAVNSKNSKASRRNALERLLRLREYCNGITVTENNPERVFSLLRQSGETCCYYCSVEISDIDTPALDGTGIFYLTECWKLICNDDSCNSQYRTDLGSEVGQHQRCPFCKIQHVTDNLIDTGDSIQKARLSSSYPSKLVALLEDVKQNIAKEKCIIFSVWKRTLDLVENVLSDNGIGYCRVDGSVSTSKKRERILLDFQQQPNLRVLLMTLGTGAVGLNNLSVASRIHLLEPQWNPSVERQAIGRVLRLGQSETVTIIRYIMKSSVEEVIEKRQNMKLQMSSGGFGGTSLVKDD